MILGSLRVAGFGRLVDRRFDFTPGLNVVYGPNESGKSTLANAVVASLYGCERKKELWRPWAGGAFSTTLVYQLASGEHVEVQRDFDRDAKGVHVYDRNGRDISAGVGGHKLVPGEAHLGVPLDVFLNAACVKQQAMAIDAGKDAAPIAAHLARALDGGPREDAALGAIARLDQALRVYVGTERARKNAPLRSLRAQADEQRKQIAEARCRLDALDDVRVRRQQAAHESERLSALTAESERRLQSLRAGTIAKQLADLHAFRTELAELQADHAKYDDVADFAADRETDTNSAFYTCEAAQRAAEVAQADALSTRFSEAERTELDQRRRDAGSIDAPTFAALSAANDRASLARSLASTAGRVAAAVRADASRPRILTIVLVAGLLALCVAIGFAVAHSWTWTGVATASAIAGLTIAAGRHRERAQRARTAAEKQRLADKALHTEHSASNAVAAVLDPLGIRTFEELCVRRTRLSDLSNRQRAADAAADRARAARVAYAGAAAGFDALTATLIPAQDGARAARHAAVIRCAARKRERDGLAAHLHALELRKSTILGSDDEYALETELAQLRRDGVEPAVDDPGTRRSIEDERVAVAEQRRIAGELYSQFSGELAGAQAHIPDLAALDEDLARTRSQIERVESFERAILLAKSTLESRTQEAHAAFARRLEDYAAVTLGTITGGRYADIFVDPTTLMIRVRVPETGAITDLDSVSAGTRDQTYLVVRFAMARMFAEGIETPPLLLDDPFAYWDAARIERCLPIIEHNACSAQAILFTASRELADAAQWRGAHRLDLPEPALV